MTLVEARHLACQAYWDAKSHEEEHAAVQRMIALGLNKNEYEPCPEPECVRLRMEEHMKVEFFPDYTSPEEFADVTREIARCLR